jgi:two-component sensor histidine kinase
MESQINNSSEKSDEISQQEEESLRLLVDTLEEINHTKEFKSVLIESMEATRIIMNSEASSLILVEKETGDLYVSMPTGPAKSEIAGKSIPKDKGIAGWVAQNKQPYVTNDINESEHFFGELAEGFKTRNIICVPIINRKNEVIGVIQALNRRGNLEFTSRDIPVFQALASNISNAIERTRMISTLHDRLLQKDAMIAEIHHRVKNNIQAIAGQIEKELMEIDDPRADAVSKQVMARMKSMSKLHEMLCEKKVNNEIDLGAYVKELAERIQDTMSFLLNDLEIVVSEKEIVLSQEKALLCGLILHELLVNVYKHAFADEDTDSPRIEINMAVDENLVILSVADNGIGFPEDFTIQSKSSIGMWIVHELLQKLQAEMSLLNDPGARFTITFSK